MSKLRKSRNSKNTESRLSALSSAAEGTDNLMPYILDAVTTYATTGEISNTLRDVFGEYRSKRGILMRIDHVAIAVEDLESAVKQYVDAFGITDIEYETVESEKVKVAILKMENASIELMASTGDGPIKKFLDTRGSGLHHVALETPDIDGQVSKMESCGVKILGGVRPGSRGTRITFVHPKSLSGVLAELCEHSK